MFCFHESFRIIELVSDRSFCFLMDLFLGANYKSMIDELSSVKKICHYGKSSKGDCD